MDWFLYNRDLRHERVKKQRPCTNQGNKIRKTLLQPKILYRVYQILKDENELPATKSKYTLNSIA